MATGTSGRPEGTQRPNGPRAAVRETVTPEAARARSPLPAGKGRGLRARAPVGGPCQGGRSRCPFSAAAEPADPCPLPAAPRAAGGASAAPGSPAGGCSSPCGGSPPPRSAGLLPVRHFRPLCQWVRRGGRVTLWPWRLRQGRLHRAGSAAAIRPRSAGERAAQHRGGVREAALPFAAAGCRAHAKTARKPLKKLGVINLLQGRTALGSRPRAEQPPPRLALSPPVTHRASRRARGVDLSCGLLHSV